jgi:hypothetical protein
MNPELQAIKDAWDPAIGDGRDADLARSLADAYVANHPEEFNHVRDLSLPDAVKVLELFRHIGNAEGEWRVEAWLMHRFEPQNIGGEANFVIRVPKPGGEEVTSA